MKKFNEEDNRIMANLEQVYESYREIRAEQLAMPNYMIWKTVSGARYLYQSTSNGERSLGRESTETTARYDAFIQRREELIDRHESTAARLKSIAAQYRALKLPMTMELPAKILQQMDMRGLLESHFLVVGSFGFAAYEIESGIRFMDGIDETEDFDISWRSPAISLPISIARAEDDDLTSLLDLARLADKSFEVSRFSPQKIVNKHAFEIDVLCATGAHFKAEVADKRKIFGGSLVPVELEGQDILHLGTPIRHVALGRGGIPTPLVVPDPRFMAIHKAWLSSRPDRSATKKAKDRKQSILLWQHCEHMLGHPLDSAFFDSIPGKWMGHAKALDADSGVRAMAGMDLAPHGALPPHPL